MARSPGQTGGGQENALTVFTGIIECVGHVRSIERRAGATFTIEAPIASALKDGDSVSISGVCQTVSKTSHDAFSFFSTEATLSLTTLKHLTQGSTVNLERAMRADGRFDGHFVTGHVDGTTSVLTIVSRPDAKHITFALPAEWARYVVRKGAIAVNGISLTVYERTSSSFTIVLIPFTSENTTMPELSVGDTVNIELDMLAKYVESLFSSKKGGKDDYLRQLLADEG
ncbi:MAG: riboflavin synthase [Spirochaetota bacterium]